MPDVNVFVANVVLVATAALLFYVAWNDLRHFKIRNDFVIALACLYGVYAFVSGEWRTAYWNLALALVMFVVLLVFYAKRWLGGGDVKILTVGFLWVGYSYAVVFTFLLLVFSLAQIVAAKFELIGVKNDDGRARIAFAPSVAGAIIGVFVIRWLGL